jgi:hypothetical protein
VIAALVGCDSGDDGNRNRVKGDFSDAASPGFAAASPAPTPAQEQRTARRAQLRLSDFPADWQQQTAHRRASCERIRGSRRAASGRAISPSFHQPDYNHQGAYPAVTSAVNLYADEAEAANWFARLSTRKTLACLAETLAERAEKRASRAGSALAVGEPTTARVHVDTVGDERAGGRVTLPLTAQGVDVDLIFDYVFVRTGRGVALLALADTQVPFDENWRAELTGTLTRRLAAALR